MWQRKDFDAEAESLGKPIATTRDTPVDNGAVPGESFLLDETWYGKINLFGTKLHVEARGIERVPEDERTDTSLSNAAIVVCPFRLTFILAKLIPPS